MRRLPHLNSLRAFEAAARLLSFSKAAEELNVTPAAVSQQVKQLEAYLGVTLFRRLTRAVQLTPQAQAVLPMMTDGFDTLAQAVERLSQTEESGLLTVSSAPTFAAKWLLPRLVDFSDRYPEIDLRIDASLDTRDFSRDGIDVSIRLGAGDYPGLFVERVFSEQVSPVCSPALLDGPVPLRTPEDLRNHRLIHVDWGDLKVPIPDWRMWTKAAGLDDIDVEHGPRFTVENMAVEAAISGSGVALISHYSVAEDLKAGRLVRPFELSLKTEFAYWLVCPHEFLHRAKVKAFCDWLMDQVRTDGRAEHAPEAG